MRLLGVPLPPLVGFRLPVVDCLPFFPFFILQSLPSGYCLWSLIPAVLFSFCITLVYFISFSWRQASGKFPSSPTFHQLQFFSAAIGRCSWRLHLSPLVRCVHGIASLARPHIGCYDRTCGDGPWSFFLPYRAMFRMVIVGFVSLYPPGCRCVAGRRILFASLLILSDASRGSWILGCF